MPKTIINDVTVDKKTVDRDGSSPSGNANNAAADLQTQINKLNDKFPVKDTDVVGTTDYLARYLLARGNI